MENDVLLVSVVLTRACSREAFRIMNKPKRRESFPLVDYSSLKRRAQDQKEEGIMFRSKIPQYVNKQVNVEEMEERRRNFAITRSKSFAYPSAGLNASLPSSNSSLTSLSRKSSFSSLVSKNNSLRGGGGVVEHSLKVLKENSGSNDRKLLFQVSISYFTPIISNNFRVNFLSRIK